MVVKLNGRCDIFWRVPFSSGLPVVGDLSFRSSLGQIGSHSALLS